MMRMSRLAKWKPLAICPKLVCGVRHIAIAANITAMYRLELFIKAPLFLVVAFCNLYSRLC